MRFSLFIVLTTTLSAQVLLTGEWQPLTHEDATERSVGPDLGDYLGIPINDAARLRAAMPQSIFLVPGYGAQGGQASDFAPYFQKDSRGALIVAGRSIIQTFAHSQSPDWPTQITAAAQHFAQDIAQLSS